MLEFDGISDGPVSQHLRRDTHFVTLRRRLGGQGGSCYRL
jgi:hypothetical protein